MGELSFMFLADCQLGAYASFSGMSEADVVEFAARDMRVEIVPYTDGFEWDAARYREAVAAINEVRPDFAVMGGDMVNDPWDRSQYEALLSLTSDLDPGIQMYWVPGNHDVGADTVVPTADSIANYRRRFGPDYYSFRHGVHGFVVLNTVVIDHPEEVPSEWERQVAFLESELEVLARETASTTVMGHHPLFLDDPDEDDNYWNLPRERRLRVAELLERYGVRKVFAGHWHRNNLASDAGLEVVTTGPVGYPLGNDPSGYRIVTLDGAHTTHDYFPLNPDSDDPVQNPIIGHPIGELRES